MGIHFESLFKYANHQHQTIFVIREPDRKTHSLDSQVVIGQSMFTGWLEISAGKIYADDEILSHWVFGTRKIFVPLEQPRSQLSHLSGSIWLFW